MIVRFYAKNTEVFRRIEGFVLPTPYELRRVSSIEHIVYDPQHETHDVLAEDAMEMIRALDKEIPDEFVNINIAHGE
jgi:hypothetical protein